MGDFGNNVTVLLNEIVLFSLDIFWGKNGHIESS